MQVIDGGPELGGDIPALDRGRIQPVLRRLATMAALSGAEVALVERMGCSVREHRAGAQLAREDAPCAPRALLAGWACRQRLLPDGRRQIFAFLVPGDIVGLRPGEPPVGTSIVALTRLTTADAEPLRRAALNPARYPGLAQILTLGHQIETARLLDHVVRLGRLSAYERVAHLLLELRERLAAVGLGDERRFPLPVTQEMLADTLGLSLVHINRVLQQLRSVYLIELKAGQVTLLDPAKLMQVAAG